MLTYLKQRIADVLNPSNFRENAAPRAAKPLYATTRPR